MPIWILKLGLNFLGFKKAIGNFIKNNWKWLVPLILSIILYFYVSHEIKEMKKEAYRQGVTAEKTNWENKVAEEDKRNREFESRLAKVINEFGFKAVEEAAKRVEKETVYKKEIRTIVESNPIYQQCRVDQEVIDRRNEIRRLGPSITVEIPEAEGVTE